MAALAFTYGDKNGMAGIRRTSISQLPHDRRVQRGMITWYEKPEIRRRRMKALLQPRESTFHGGPHVRCLLRQPNHAGAGALGDRGQLRYMRSSHYENLI